MNFPARYKLLTEARWANRAKLLALVFGLTLSGFSLAMQSPAPVAAQAQADAHTEFPQGPGREETLRLCSRCHSPNNILAIGRTQDGWKDLIVRMTTFGLQGTDEDFTATLDYLTANFPPKIYVNRASAAQLKSAMDLTAEEAAAIVSYRDKNGNYKSLDGLKRVAGVDPKKLDAKKDLLQF